VNVAPAFHKLRWWTKRRRKERELQEELRFHLDEEAEQRRAEGLTTDEAALAARRDLGNVTVLKESIRDMWTWTFLEQLAQDARYALRALMNSRGFTALAAVSLALGIGANTAIYSFMDSILLRSLPVSDPESLVVLNWRSKDPRVPGKEWRPFVMHSVSGNAYNDETGLISGIFPFPAFELFQNADAVFSTVFAYYAAGNLNLMIHGDAELARGEYVSGDYFRGLAVVPAAGRLLVTDDDRPGAPPVVVVSSGLSQRRLGGPSNATGQSILINNIQFTVVGVAPAEFFGVDPAAAPDCYLPLHANLLVNGTGLGRVTPQDFLDPHYYWIDVMARLRPGVTIARAQAVLAPSFQQWVAGTATMEERANLPALLVREGAGGLDTLRRRYSKPLFVLLTVVGLILAIACANIANLLLARATARRREIAVRLSLGAGRLRVMRQLLTESILLASVGGALGILFAVWGVGFLTLLLANGQEHFTLHAELNWHVLGATLAVSLLCGILFGLAPAIQSTRADVMSTLKNVRGSLSRIRAPLGFLRMNLSHVLVVSQIAISLLLLVAAGLFVRTVSNLHSVQLGFNREDVLLFELNARQAGHREPEIATFYADLRRQLAAIPGVRHASLAHASLIGAGRQLAISVSGTPAPGTRVLNTGPEFFTTMQIPIRLGREIDERDQPASPPVAVVNELFAGTYFGGENPIGRHIQLGGPNPRDMEIVGVSANVRYDGLKERYFPIVFIPYNQGSFPPVMRMTYALRTTGNPLRYVKTVRDVVHQADAHVPLTDVKTQAGEIDQTINQEIVFANLCTGFASLALLIACVGLYGTMAYTVARRTSEIGIRMALGARRGTVIRMVLREVVVLAAIGLAISVPTALIASKFVGSFLFGMQPNDPRALTSAGAILLGAVLLAGYAPAWKASRIDPMMALRHE
jgi:macrolide transport system ATP-binding/permease protein